MIPATPVRFEAAQFPEHRGWVEAIFREYLACPSVSLCFQNFEAELADLPGAYAPPHGALWLAWQGDRVVGCAAFRRVEEGVCELKRVYMQPAVRGQQCGRKLVEHMLRLAHQAGYRRMCLDVLPEFKAAQALYADLGFTPAPPVTHNPVPGTLFLGRDLPL